MSNKAKKENLKPQKGGINFIDYFFELVKSDRRINTDCVAKITARNSDLLESVDYDANLDLVNKRANSYGKITFTVANHSHTMVIMNAYSEYKRVAEEISTLFMNVYNNNVDQYICEDDYSDVLKIKEDDNNKTLNLKVSYTLSRLIVKLEELLMIAVENFIKYTTALGYFGNLQVKKDANLIKLIGICVRILGEPLVPLLTSLYLWSIGNLYTGKPNVWSDSLGSKNTFYPKKDFDKVINIIDEINQDLFAGWFIKKDKFFNDQIFKGWMNYLSDPMFRRCSDDGVFKLIRPCDLDYNYNFFNHIISYVVLGKMMDLADDNSLKLSFIKAVKTENTEEE